MSKPPPALTDLQFYTTASYPCSYLHHQSARSQVATPLALINTESYAALLTAGFRRSGLFTYRPSCDHCQACIPVRIEIAQFHPNRSQQRAWQRHQELQTTMMPLGYQAEHYALYLNYQTHRHQGGGMDKDNHAQYRQFLLESKINSYLLEFREPTIANNKTHVSNKPDPLRMVSVIDITANSLSSVYTFYDTSNPHDSFGTFSILWQIEYARQLNLTHLYLGYWIKESRKMAYKANFRPLQGFIDGQWQTL